MKMAGHESGQNRWSRCIQGRERESELPRAGRRKAFLETMSSQINCELHQTDAAGKENRPRRSFSSALQVHASPAISPTPATVSFEGDRIPGRLIQIQTQETCHLCEVLPKLR